MLEFQDCCEQFVFAPEVVVQRTFCDARLLGNLIDVNSCKAVSEKECVGRIEYAPVRRRSIAHWYTD